MKQLIVIGCLFITLASFWGCKTVVPVRPPEPSVMVVRPPQPGPSYVWVEGEWYSRGGKYYRSPGSWVRAKRGRSWVQGHWANNKRGHYWVGGYWK